MNYFKKSLLFLVLMSFMFGFFCSPDLSAIKRRPEDVTTENQGETGEKRRKIEPEIQKTITSKNGEMLFFSFNNHSLFKNKCWKAFNETFIEKIYRSDEKQWLSDNQRLIESLEKGDSKYFFHAIKDKEDRVVSFAYGFLYEKGVRVGIDFLGTIPAFKKQGLAWLLIVSIFDRYHNAKKISLSASKSSVSFYVDHGFTEGFDGDFELLRSDLKSVKKALEEKYKRKKD